jgi:hypothetical protein
VLARNKECISFSLFLLVLTISISTNLLIHLDIKKRRFFYIVREENIWPQVLGDRIYPPFSQHYEKNKCKNCIKMKNVNLFIQIAYYTHMGQAITIQKHANIKKKNNTNIINMLMFNYLFPYFC